MYVFLSKCSLLYLIFKTHALLIYFIQTFFEIQLFFKEINQNFTINKTKMCIKLSLLNYISKKVLFNKTFLTIVICNVL